MLNKVRKEAHMVHRVAFLPLLLLLGIMFLGCEPTPPVATGPAPPPGSVPPAAAVAPPAAVPSSQAPLPPETKFGVFAGDVNDLAARPNSPSPTPPQPAQTERVKAQAGVGAKGRSLDQYEGVIVTPVKAYFAGKERAFFDIEFPGNYQRWRVLEDRAPKDFEELKAKFLDPLGLTKHLPVLPSNAKYIWD